MTTRPSLSVPFSVAALALAACAGEEAGPAAPGAAPQPDPADIEAARAAAGALGGRLRARLVATMAAEGPVAAIAVCNEAAPVIAADVSAETGMSVGRTALRVRNPSNAPDDFERETLEFFLARLGEGADPAALERAEFVHGTDGLAFRYMKPIMTGAPCLACHGTEISKPIRVAINERYPEDEGTGFALGDMRGAFTIEKRLEN
ncbi:MAG: DUF3365 domain-containing protein [Pseudomonadota bacterium]